MVLGSKRKGGTGYLWGFQFCHIPQIRYQLTVALLISVVVYGRRHQLNCTIRNYISVAVLCGQHTEYRPCPAKAAFVSRSGLGS